MITVHTLVLIFSCTFAIIVLYEILPPFGVQQITVTELNELLAKQKTDYQYIDVRPENQFNEMHVFGFKNIPLKELKREVDHLSKDRKIVVICQRGTLGNEACKFLKRQGFTNLANVRGGIITWQPHRKLFP